MWWTARFRSIIRWRTTERSVPLNTGSKTDRKRRKQAGLRSPVWIAALASLAIAGCGGSNTRGPAPVWRVLDEARAVDIIRRAVIAQGGRPVSGQPAGLPDGGTVRVDVAFADQPHGIAFISEQDANKLGKKLPPPPPGEELRIIKPDDSTLVVLLYSDRYRYDVGPSHAGSLVAAERRLTKDVTDFIVHLRGLSKP